MRWNDDEGVYRCTCHDGVYDADGRVVSGPPTTPLADVPVTVMADSVSVGA